MANNFKFVQNQATTLAGAGSSIGDTSIILTNFLDINGVQLTMADFGAKAFATIEPGSGVNEEQISFSGITQNGNGTATITGVKTVLFKSPYTETSGLAKSHIGGVQFIISNTAGFYNELLSTDNDETINGLYTFTQFPITPSTAPTTNYQVANKKYVDDAVVSGAPNANTTTKGIVQLPTQAQVDAKTSVGSTGASLTPTPANLRSTQYNDYVVDTGSASTYVIAPSPVITAYATGQQFTFIAITANSANSGVSTLAVNGLAQKTIKKYFNTSLVVNDIVVGQVVTVVYDGTNFQMINPVGQGYVDLTSAQTISSGIKIFSVLPQSSAVPGTGNDLTNKTYVDALSYITSTNGTTTKNAADASTTQTIAHGLGRTPKAVRIICRCISQNSGNAVASAETYYNGTTQSSQSVYGSGTNTLTVDSTFRIGTNNTAGSSDYQTGVVTVDGTNISIAWTKSASASGTFQILWQTL